MTTDRTPRVLFIYYTFTKQALRVTEDMESVFRERGWEITRAQIELTDQRYAPRFKQFPLKHRYLDIVRLLPAQLRRASGEIRVPPEAERGDYRYLGVKIPPTNLQPDGDDAARAFAARIVDRLEIVGSTAKGA